MFRTLILALVVAAAALAATAALDTWPWTSTTTPSVDPVDANARSAASKGTRTTVAAHTKNAQVNAEKSVAPTNELGITRHPKKGSFELADGTYAPCLNGVHAAPAMNWPREIPFSPIVRKMADPEGKEWYVHADGSYSNTEMLYRSDLKKWEAVTNVANPQKVQPMDRGTAKLGPRR